MEKTEFIALVMPFKDKLYRLAKRILISSDEAEDAVQEVFLKLWKGKQHIEASWGPDREEVRNAAPG